MKKQFTRIVLLLSIGLLIAGNVFAQDPHFTQAFANPLKLNPAIMGPGTDLKVILHNRSQWHKINNGYNTKSFSVLYPWLMKDGKEKLDIGVNFMSDKAGAFSSTDFSCALGYNIRMTRNGFFSFSLQGGFLQKSIDLQKLSFDEQYIYGSYDSGSPNGEVTLTDKVSVPDVGFGAMWYYNPSKDQDNKLNAYSGISIFHLNTPNESFTASNEGELPMRFCYQGGIKILGDNKFDFTPNIRLSKQGGSEEIAPGVYVDYRINGGRIVLGTWYRLHDAVAFSLGVEHKNFTLGYSYDAVTDLKNYVSGSNAHEITLSFKLSVTKKEANAQFENNVNGGHNLPANSNIFSPF